MKLTVSVLKTEAGMGLFYSKSQKWTRFKLGNKKLVFGIDIYLAVWLFKTFK